MGADDSIGVQELLRLEEGAGATINIEGARLAEHEALSALLGNVVEHLKDVLAGVGNGVGEDVDPAAGLAAAEEFLQEFDALLKGAVTHAGDVKDLVADAELPLVGRVLGLDDGDGILEATARGPQLAVERYVARQLHDEPRRRKELVTLAAAEDARRPVPVGAHAIQLLRHVPAGRVPPFLQVPLLGQQRLEGGILGALFDGWSLGQRRVLVLVVFAVGGGLCLAFSWRGCLLCEFGGAAGIRQFESGLLVGIAQCLLEMLACARVYSTASIAPGRAVAVV